MSREEQLENAVLILSIGFVYMLRVFWDFLPRGIVKNFIGELEESMKLFDKSKTKTIRSDLNKLKRQMNKEDK